MFFKNNNIAENLTARLQKGPFQISDACSIVALYFLVSDNQQPNLLCADSSEQLCHQLHRYIKKETELHLYSHSVYFCSADVPHSSLYSPADFIFAPAPSPNRQRI